MMLLFDTTASHIMQRSWIAKELKPAGWWGVTCSLFNIVSVLFVASHSVDVSIVVLQKVGWF